MLPVWPLLVYFFISGLGADFQALISPSGVAGIDQAGKCTQMMRSKLIPVLFLTFASYADRQSSHLLQTGIFLLIVSYVLVFGCKTLNRW